MWTQLATPSPDDLAEELKTAGLTAASTIAVATTLAKKKKGGKGMGSHNRKLKITNTHLKDLGIDLSKDFVKGK
jgi:transcription initiation factor TFIIE subunit beta